MKWKHGYSIALMFIVVFGAQVQVRYERAVTEFEIKAKVDGQIKNIRMAALKAIDEELAKDHSEAYVAGFTQYRECADSTGGIFALDEYGDCVAPAINTVIALGGDSMTAHAMLAVVRKRAAANVEVAQRSEFNAGVR